MLHQPGESVMHEVRFRGAFVSLFTDKHDAIDHVRVHEKATNKEHAKGFSIAEARRFWVYCRGNLVDTCESKDDAQALIEKLAHFEDAPAAVWEIADTKPARVADANATLDETE